MAMKEARPTLKAKRLREGDTLPSFGLPEARGSGKHVWDYHGKRNLVLVFVHDVDCRLCRMTLRSLMERYEELMAEETEVLAVAPGPAAEVALRLVEPLGLLFPVLIDESAFVHRSVGAVDENGNPQAATIVADRFGEIAAARYEQGGHGLIGAGEAISILAYLNSRCPECGISEWPAA